MINAICFILYLTFFYIYFSIYVKIGDLKMENIQNSQASKRWEYIDLLEFIGILFVIIYHSTTYSYSFIEQASAINYIRYFLRTLLSTCVPLFFFVNGYLILNRPFNLKKHIIKTISLIVLTVIWGLISILLFMPIKGEYLTIKEILQYLWMWQSGWINHLWYMGALVCIYIFVPIFKVAFDNKRNYFIYFTIICAILTFGNKFLGICGTIFTKSILKLESSYLDFNFFNMFSPFRRIYGYSFVYFCAGGLVHDIVPKIKNIDSKRRNIIASIVLIVSTACLFGTGIVLSKVTGKMWEIVYNGYDTIFTFINVCALFVLSLSYNPSKDNIATKFIRSVSCNTLGIYYIHQIIRGLTHPWVMHCYWIRNFIGCTCYSLLLLIICLLIVIGIGKIPFLNCLVNLKKIEKIFYKKN